MSNLEAGKLFNVNGLVAVITGGGSGIGLMMAKALDANGAAKVYIIGRRKETLEAAAKQGINGSIVPLQGDVTSKDSPRALAKQIESEVGFVNVVIANSGITGPSVKIPEKPSLAKYQEALWNASMEDFTNTFAVNCSGMFYTVLAFLPLLEAGNAKGNVEQKSQVIATSSIGGFSRRPLGGFAYGASKAATTHLMKSVATVFAPYHIRSNVIAPGLYPSEMTNGRLVPADGTQEGSYASDYIPLTRAGSEEDMAGTVLYLCSRAGSYCNGMVAVTDGGRLSVFPATY